ncbi:sigma factor-like helix-turn-helix DNA-binding protein [Staphylococcus pettenkoferi]|uniref:sigma factor-like helix-turn-helix DNA-binding protein n=1 Tax=Staphylococcus pettenkoferi TaxID=170573 RepID=UPI0009D93BA9
MQKKNLLCIIFKKNLDNDRYIILKMRLQGFTLQQIADEIKLTRERVRQIVKKVIENITIHVREDKNLYWV